METFMAAGISNEAHALQRAGNYVGAEAKFLEALELKIRGSGNESSPTAMTRNGLGELYLTMGKMNEALEQLSEAERVRSMFNADTDTAITRDNLGRFWEMKGDLEKAQEWRTKELNKMVCSYYSCQKTAPSSPVILSTRAELKACVRCKSTFYCGRECQRKDWKERHKSYCKAPDIAPTSS